MTNRSNDDIANALHGLASGEHVEPELPEGSGTGQQHHFDPAAPSPAPPAPPVRQSRQAPPVPQLPQRATPKPVLPRAGGSAPPPAAARPATAPMRPRAHPQPQPPGQPPVRPAVRQPAPAVPPSPGGMRPASPAAPEEVETTDVQPVDEDDRVIVPAAPLSALGPRTSRRVSATRVPLFKTLGFRRTAIPVLLTSGALLLFVAALPFLVSPDAVLATLPVGRSIALTGAGLLLLCVAGVNMALVRRQLTAGDTPKA